MQHQKSALIRLLLALVGVVILGLLAFTPSLSSRVWGQFPTVDMPTVTSSPRGLYVRAIGLEYDTLNVRSYPSSASTLLGVFFVGQEANAYGYYGDYVQIEYPGAPGNKGWILLNRVEVFGGTLSQLEPPATETPSVTKTIDPTLAAQFVITLQPSRLPTYTEPPPLMIPTYEESTGATAAGGIPMGYIIVVLAGLGLFLTLIAVLRRGQ